MDLVEIRKKAKNRKTKKKKTPKEPEKVVREETSLEEQSPEAEAVTDPVDVGGVPQESREKGEGGPAADPEEQLDEKAEESADSLSSLNAVLMSQHEEVVDEEEEQLQLLTFKLGGEEYALNIMDIKEIIRPKETTEVPKTPDYILGIFSLRGTIIPVFDVCIRLGLTPGERGAQNRIVVVKSQEHLFGLYVDSVVQVLDIPLSKIEPPPEILGGVEGEFLRGIGRIDDRLIILLNLVRILKLDEGEGSGHLELTSG